MGWCPLTHTALGGSPGEDPAMVRNTKRTEFTDPNLNCQRTLSELWFSIQGEGDARFELRAQAPLSCQ